MVKVCFRGRRVSLDLKPLAFRLVYSYFLSMAPQELASLYSQLKTEFSSNNPDLQKCGVLLSKLKVDRFVLRILEGHFAH